MFSIWSAGLLQLTEVVISKIVFVFFHGLKIVFCFVKFMKIELRWLARVKIRVKKAWGNLFCRKKMLLSHTTLFFRAAGASVGWTLKGILNSIAGTGIVCTLFCSINIPKTNQKEAGRGRAPFVSDVPLKAVEINIKIFRIYLDNLVVTSLAIASACEASLSRLWSKTKSHCNTELKANKLTLFSLFTVCIFRHTKRATGGKRKADEKSK